MRSKGGSQFVRAAALLAALPGAGARAEGSGGRPAPPRAEGAAPQDRGRLEQQVIDQMRALRMWKITEELKLDEATATRLFPVLARFDEQAKALGGEKGELHQTLRAELAQPTPDPGRVDALVDRLLANRARRLTLEQERFKATRKVLTPVQQAKLLLLLPRIEDGFRRRIHEAMERERGGGPGDKAPAGSGAAPRRP